MLYQGTRTTDPKLIYEGHEGFDIRFCPRDGGMWGIANYFALNASYSDMYKHTRADGLKQMFYARVIIGNTIVLNPDKTLNLPPLIK